MLSKGYKSTKVDWTTWLHLPSETLKSLFLDLPIWIPTICLKNFTAKTTIRHVSQDCYIFLIHDFDVSS